eukprot:TRINITY_DN9064_c0_g1_i2.p1 TRINITY_DN9064_c0_g1~~TRINITY_DN9064_c0_g1_i2.p1  ORF type:complete len:134 (+),score=17.61 TRINITY_DN9064_c0_g1_i2:103-504(+)
MSLAAGTYSFTTSYVIEVKSNNEKNNAATSYVLILDSDGKFTLDVDEKDGFSQTAGFTGSLVLEDGDLYLDWNPFPPDGRGFAPEEWDKLRDGISFDVDNDNLLITDTYNFFGESERRVSNKNVTNELMSFSA